MPRSAATILGLILVAFSIGFNTTRYPVVWEMANPARATEAAQPTEALQPEKPESLAPTAPHETVPASSHPTLPIRMQPASEIAGRIIIDASESGRNGSASSEATDWDKDAAAGVESRKPLVPVTSVGLPSASVSTVVGGAGIRRLPPVERTSSDVTKRVLARSSDGTIPVYPSTGIE